MESSKSVVHSAYVPRDFFDKLIAVESFPISGLQVEGGAKFKSVFDAECEARGLELFVLPPKRPDLNGCIERAQFLRRYEF